MGEFGLPRAVVIASYMRVPPTTSQLPGSSATSKGHPTIPNAVRPLLDSTLRRGCRPPLAVNQPETRPGYPVENRRTPGTPLLAITDTVMELPCYAAVLQRREFRNFLLDINNLM